ncbi:transcription factor BIM2-like isoform X2 [Impatiens glandulifera]|uniref:transcription factor BIM2-like isoform X2 n=1 Tax=Impatiens glandulifera TaxID=253017 RepID=UPI001FB08CCD|nr:transcription factor BIM2-like isoform X2 [Impatiens glandulifera]XP_047314366.1 transcription factor BIM2-like isoform X2 [Impatiens glandulifera]
MMNSMRGHHEEEEDEDEELGSKKDNTSTSARDDKNNDKANAVRTKHSVTEQRRRSKINERFQILRDLIPHSDQKRDTSSFLLEVIEYVQYLQEEVQKYEGSYPGLSPEPSKLMTWRNSHWRVQNLIGQPQATKNGVGPGTPFSGRFDDIALPPTIQSTPQNLTESEPCKNTAQLPNLLKRGANAMPFLPTSSVPIQSEDIVNLPLQRPVSDTQSTEIPVVGNEIDQQDHLMIEGGTISISSVYSEGLLNNLAKALQDVGLDLSQATISVQIDLGKQANSGFISGISHSKEHENNHSDKLMENLRDESNNEDADQAQKRLKTRG